MKYLELMQNLRTGLPVYFRNYFTKSEGEGLYYFRVFAFFLWFNIIAVLVFADLPLFTIVNPLRFLDSPPQDTRQTLVLYYPVDIDLSGLTSEHGERQIVKVNQKVETGNRRAPIPVEEQIVNLIQYLFLGPDGVRGNKLPGEPGDIKKIWVNNQQVILHYNPAGLSKTEIELAKSCIESSILENFSDIKSVKFYLSRR